MTRPLPENAMPNSETRAHQPLRFGIIGCGRIAPRHAQSFQQVAASRLVAVADLVADLVANLVANAVADAVMQISVPPESFQN